MFIKRLSRPQKSKKLETKLRVVDWRLHRIIAGVKNFYVNHPGIVLFARTIIIFSLFFLVCWFRLDSDFGWHLKAGDYIRAHGIPTHDLYTYTASNFRWINHEWGNDVLLSLLYQTGGYLLSAVFFAGLWTLVMFLAGRQVKPLILFAGAIALLPYMGIRPTVWSVLGLVLLMKIVNSQKTRIKFFIPLLFVVWANLHGGFVIGLIYLAYLTITRRSKTWLLILLASILATFINVYGPGLYEEIARTMLDRSLRGQVAEWQPFFILAASWPYIMTWIIGFWLFDKSKLHNWWRFDVALFVAAFSSSRNVPLFVVASLPITENYLLKSKSLIPKNLDLSRQIVLSLFILIGLGSLVYGLKNSYLPFAYREDGYPVKAVAYLRDNPCLGNLYNDYNFGGYLIWKLPEVPVYIDGRMPSWRDPGGIKYMDTYLKIPKNQAVREAEFKRYNIRCALVMNSGENRRLIIDLQKNGWQRITRANGALLLIKTN